MTTLTTATDAPPCYGIGLQEVIPFRDSVLGALQTPGLKFSLCITTDDPDAQDFILRGEVINIIEVQSTVFPQVTQVSQGPSQINLDIETAAELHLSGDVRSKRSVTDNLRKVSESGETLSLEIPLGLLDGTCLVVKALVKGPFAPEGSCVGCPLFTEGHVILKADHKLIIGFTGILSLRFYGNLPEISAPSE